MSDQPFLLDTNVISEIWKPAPDPKVITWLENEVWYIPVPAIAEIQAGIEANQSATRRAQLNQYLTEFLADHEALIINWDQQTSRTWGQLAHSSAVRLKPQSLWDSLIDAMGIRYGCKVATRNKSDFRHAETFDPWID